MPSLPPKPGVPLPGTVNGAVKLEWLVLAGPAAVKFANSAQAPTTATSTVPGHYSSPSA